MRYLIVFSDFQDKQVNDYEAYLDGTVQVYRIEESGFYRLTGKEEVAHG